MKQNKWKKMGILAAAVSMLWGCTDRKHYEEAEQNALKYYKNKYDLKDVSVVRSWKAGNYGLFGYIGVKDRAYEMSDGNTVYWADSTQKVADSRQAREIAEAFAKEIMDPLLDQFSFPKKVSSYSLNRTGYESYDECVFTAYFDGDIRSFLKKEQPAVRDLDIVLETEDQNKAEQEITALYDALKGNITGWGTAYILKDGLNEITDDVQYVDDCELNVTARADLRFEETLRWYRQKYIEVFDGIYMTSRKTDFVLEDGDLRFEQAGTCADLQKMLDDSYYAMPVDAEENKKGGYLVKDQRHENRVVLDDPSAPLYRLSMSERVRNELDSRNSLSVMIMDTRTEGEPLMIYYGTKSTASFDVYRVIRAPGTRGKGESVSPDQYFYFGTHQSMPFEEKKEQ
ncbi:MAG: hypothetical protein K6A40_01560 [Solobacterium sp.]|nr:hypothetical protein [Solobacterium sp.]